MSVQAMEPLQGRRVAVIGGSGAGKSTLAKALSRRLSVPHVELDALNWRPGWRALSREDPAAFTAAVESAVAGEGWVTDGSYTKGALAVILPIASDVVWLDYSRAVIMSRVLRRSVYRAARRDELWPGTGNREDFARWIRKDHPIRWTWDTYRDANARRAALFDSPSLDHVRKHRLRSPKAAALWLGGTGA